MGSTGLITVDSRDRLAEVPVRGSVAGKRRVAVDERVVHHGRIGTRLQPFDVVPLAQLFPDPALRVMDGLIFVAEPNGRLVSPGAVAHLLANVPDVELDVRIVIGCFIWVSARR